MNKTERKALEAKLNDEINSTQKKIEEYTRLCKPIAPENAIGRISRMDAINNKSVIESALRTVKEKMKQLNYMQKNFMHADFGICFKCKRPIPFGRIIIQPQSKFCVKCAK